MEDPLPSPQEYLAASRKTNSMCLILAPKIEGCVTRRYDFPDATGFSWLIQLCFAQKGPITPIISLNFSKYLNVTGASLNYFSMLEDRRIRMINFLGPKIPGSLHLNEQPEALAAKLHKMIQAVDFPEMVAAGTVERIFAAKPNYPAPWVHRSLALCGVYLRKFKEADQLLDLCLTQAKTDGRSNFAEGIAIAETYQQKLHADPEALRQELIAMMNSNWSHFKVVDAES